MSLIPHDKSLTSLHMGHAKQNCLQAYVNSEGLDQPAQACRLIKAFTVHLQNTVGSTFVNMDQTTAKALMILCMIKVIQIFRFHVFLEDPFSHFRVNICSVVLAPALNNSVKGLYPQAALIIRLPY